MGKKANSIIFAVLTAINVVPPHASKIVPGVNPLTAAATIVGVLSIPSKSEAAITPVRIVQQIAVFSMPQNCDASIVEQLCSSVTNFLDDEAAKTGADLKACKDKCGWKKRKDDLIGAARKKAKESCSKGEAPDVNELGKGLDRNTKDRLKGLYDRNSRMFDGKAKLEAANFGAVSSKNTAITGKGGQVTNFKFSEPDTPKLNSATEFSLAGKSAAPIACAKTAITTTAKANAAGMDPVADCEGTIEAWKNDVTLKDKAGYIATCKCTGDPTPVCRCPQGQDFNEQWQCVPSGKLKIIADKMRGIIRALRAKLDAIAIALWGKEPKEPDGYAWVECDGKGNFRIDFPWNKQAEALAVCKLRDCIKKHEAAHLLDDITTYPDRCKGEAANTSDLWGADKYQKFRNKSECHAYLDVTIPCLAKGMSTASEPCKSQLKKTINEYKRLTYTKNKCDTDFGYPSYFKPYPGY